LRIALTFNLRKDASPEEAEFDSAETVESIAACLRQLGHQVEKVEVGGPVSHLVARLDALEPELVLNLAEGKRGRFREGFYPGLFEQMGLPYTGSDAYTCTLTLDKHLTKLALLEKGVPVPPWAFISQAGQLDEAVANLKFPLIVKPNFEGSSIGVSQDSVAEDAATLRALVARLLPEFEAGLMVEEFIAGRDVTVPYLGEILEPCEYILPEGGGRYNIYDFAIKHALSDQVGVRVPAKLGPELRGHILDYTATTISATGLRDFGRVDFRVSEAGKPYVIEVNALPDMRAGSSLYLAARQAWGSRPEFAGEGLQQAVLERLLELACQRHGLDPKASQQESRPLKVGVAYNLKSLDADELMADDSQAEFDSPSTVKALMDAIAEAGHRVVGLEATPEFARKVGAAGVDMVFNIAEGVRGRNREAQVPSILELLDIPYTGSDPACLCLTLDKGLAKRIVAQAGVPTPRWLLMSSGSEPLPDGFTFPLMVKPLAEGSSKGVGKASVAETEIGLRAVVVEMVRRYGQPALVEQFVGGREFTVGLLGESEPKVLPIMEVIFTRPGVAHPIYGFEQKLSGNDEVRFECPANLDPELREGIAQHAKTAFKALGCRDVARIDFRMDGEGTIHFIECNPLPGLTPNFSDLAVIGLAAGLSYHDLVRDIMAPCVRRVHERLGQGSERERALARMGAS
jgi:D-alanine-D-alanine ligase